MSVMKRRVSASAVAVAAAACAFGVSSAASASSMKVNWSKVTSAKAGGGMAALVAAAKAEKTLNVIALPPTWANYGKEISTFEKKYGIKISSFNPNGTSAQEVQALSQDKGRSSEPDVIDVGESYTVANGFDVSPYKVATWKNIPAAAKASNGSWYNDYG